MCEEQESVRQLLRDRHVCVVIPTYNNGSTIVSVVRDVLAYCEEVIVVNDGSTDDTASLLAAIDGITVIHYPENRGKGYALKRGLQYALSCRYAYAITLDGDSQHLAKDIAAFAKANIQFPKALIVGKRTVEQGVRSRGSDFANRFSNFWFTLYTGYHGIDTQCGYRLYPLTRLHCLWAITSRYEGELSLLVFAAWQGIALRGIPIDVYYPPEEQRVSSFRPREDFLRIALLNTILFGVALIYGLPRRVIRWLLRFCRAAYTAVTFFIVSLLIVFPIALLTCFCMRQGARRTARLHRLIHSVARFVMIFHGIPCVTFRRDISDESVLTPPSVIICNHQSHFDIFALQAIKEKVVFLTNEWVWTNIFYGYLIRHCEYLRASLGVDKLIPMMQSLVSRGYSIVVFPEGTRSASGEIQRFHQGAFHIAQQLGIGVVPVILYGADKVFPKHTHSLNTGKIVVSCCSQWSREQLDALGSPRQQAQFAHKWYCDNYAIVRNKEDLL